MYDEVFNVVLPQPEIWKPVRGFEGRYEVSNYGQVKSLPLTKTWTRKDGIQGGKTWPSKVLTKQLKSGYHQVHLRDDDRSKYWSVHKIVSEAFHDDISLPVVDHKDDNKTNNLLWNLQRCTVKYNTSKAVNNGQLTSGNARYSRPLSESVKEKVKELLSKGVSIRKIERDLGVSQRSVARIRDGLI